MKNSFSLTLLFLLCSNLFSFLFAQAPVIQWQNSFGGSGADVAQSIRQTPDGGFIVAGSSRSDDSEVTRHHGELYQADAWIVKLDSMGNLQWQRSYGGSAWDDAVCIRLTSDGGYIFTGSSSSSDGDIYGHHGSTQFSDVWVVKLDIKGNIEWEKSYGGSSDDEPYDIQLTYDGGYIVAASTASTDGDVTGHHGGPTTLDYWIIKLSDMGDIQWEQCYGGSLEEEPCSILQIPESGYFVAGYSTSDDGDVTEHHGSSSVPDVWAIKLNKTGKIVGEESLPNWEPQIPHSVCFSNEGGYLISGSSAGSFPKHGVNGYGLGDLLLMKLSKRGRLDTVCRMGGSDDDNSYAIIPTKDGGYISVGQTFSSDGNVTGHHCGANSYCFTSDYWVLKMDSLLRLQWEEALGGGKNEIAHSVQQCDDGGYIIAGESDSYYDGQVTDNHGSADYWIVKLAPDNTPAKTISADQERVSESAASHSTLAVLSNPASNFLNVTYHASQEGILELDDLTGRTILQQTASIGDNSATLDVSKIPQGIYLIRLSTGNDALTKKLEIVH